jgi:predicted AAA+ superfamily ATPase
MIDRHRHLEALRTALQHYPVVAILGARQVGKTTLARELAEGGEAHFFDLEHAPDLERLSDPVLALDPLRGLVVLDEIQRRPELFPVLRVLADRPGTPARFLVLGSASWNLLRQSSETLAGRIHFHELTGFSVEEVGVESLGSLWLRGGFPRSFLAPTDEVSFSWRRDFVKTFVERDLPELGSRIESTTMRRFWAMLAHVHGQVWNGSELARSFGVSMPTVRRYLDLLTSALVVRQLQPWHENLAKRQVRSPKAYIVDTGLLHTLLDIENRDDLEGHPKSGASWEGFVLHEVVQRLGVAPENAYFWATQSGAELDLLVTRGARRWGFEIKRTSAPKLTSSMHIALADLKLDRLEVIHAGEHTFPMAERVRAVPLRRIGEDLSWNW